MSTLNPLMIRQLLRSTACGLALLVVASVPARAQDSLKANVFDVEKNFKPVLSEAMKIPSNPNPEVPEIKTPVFEYQNIPDTRHEAVPTIYTIKPLAMGTSLLPKLKNNYGKLGYGNYNSPLVELYLNTTRNKNLQAGFFAKHLSSNPSGQNAFSNNVLYGYGKKFLPKGVVSADAMYYRNNVYLYGYPPDYAKPLSSDIRQLFQTFELKGAYGNIVKDSNGTNVKLGASYYHFSDARSGSENDFKLYTDISKRLQGNPLNVFAQLDITGVQNPLTDYQRVYFDLNPRYTLNGNRVYIKLGFNSVVFSDSAGTSMHFYPVAEAGYALIPKGVTAYAGITGNMQRHTYRSIANENPFTRELEFRNTMNTFEFYGGVKGSLGPQTSFLLQAGISRVQNLMFYGVDSNNYNAQRVIYDTTSSSVTNVKAELTHEFDDKFRVAITFNYYRYGLELAHPYSRPTLETKWNAMYNISDKFILRADIFTMNKRYAKVFGIAGDHDETLKGLVDLNLGIDYLYNKNVSVFLNLNNLTNNTYQRWYSYPVYGFNVMGGLTITF